MVGNAVMIIDVKDEPKLEQDKVGRLLKKYTRLLKALMGKYSNTGYQVRRVSHLPNAGEGGN